MRPLFFVRLKPSVLVAMLAVALWVQVMPSLQRAQAQTVMGSHLRLLSRWTSPLPPQGAGGLCESVAFDMMSQRLFVANSLSISGQPRYVRVEVLDLTNPEAPTTLASLNLSAFGAEVSSVTVHNGILAAAMIQETKTDSGRVVFVNVGGTVEELRNATTSAVSVAVGAQPDMLTFTPDGRRVLVANEGEPSGGTSYLPDPEGSVSIIDLPAPVNGVVNLRAINQASVRFVRFNEFNVGGSRHDELRTELPRLHFPSPTSATVVAGALPGRLVTLAQDVEPEYIAVSPDSRTAFVTLQENNAWAIIDLETARVRSIRAMGFKDHSRPGNGFDASDRSASIKIWNWNVLGMYQPDALAAFAAGGRTFVASVNEGDTRDYPPSYSEETRLGAAQYVLDQMRFPMRDSLKRDSVLGRLVVTRARGDIDGDGDFDEIYLPGGRSLAIWDDNGELVWDSGDLFERVTAQQLPRFFNSNRDATTLKARSDDKGPEPEGIATAQIGDSIYCYAGLERTGGIMVFNVTDPRNPRFVQYITTRDYSRAIAGDVSTEAILTIPASANRLRRPLVVASHEVSGTVSIFTADNAPTSVQHVHSALQSGVQVATLGSGVFLCSIPTFGAQAVTVHVSSLLGKPVQSVAYTGTQHTPMLQHLVDVSNQGAGVYFLTIHCGERTLTHKFIVER